MSEYTILFFGLYHGNLRHSLEDTPILQYSATALIKSVQIYKNHYKKTHRQKSLQYSTS